MDAEVRRLRLAPAVGLLILIGLIALPPTSASAQLNGLFVTVTSPASGSTVGGTITVTANANFATQGVQFELDGVNLGLEDTTSPYSTPWNTKTSANGSHTLRARARNALGVTVTSDPVTVTVFNDTTPPTVTMTAPASGANVAGTISVSASASDNVGVIGVQFRLDGAPLGVEDTSVPYSIAWDTLNSVNGNHVLTAVARDAEGNTRTAAPVTVTVLNDRSAPSVSITAPSSGATVHGTIAVSANASDDVGVVGVQFRLDGAALGAEDKSAPYSVTWDTLSAANGSHTLTAIARDAKGNATTAQAVTVTVLNDTTQPSVSMTAPSSGARVSGTITVSADASDNVGVVGVQFQLDGAALGAQDTTAPYSISWDTLTASEGAHALTAVARDQAGNTRTSSAVNVTVSNTGLGRGDLFVGFLDGHVQWHGQDGTLKRTLVSGSDGEASGLAFDAAGNLYVPHWYSKVALAPGNTVRRFDNNLELIGTFGSGYDCNPSSFAFDAVGNVYVGQADCSGDIFKFDANGTKLASFDAAVGVRGADHIDLAPDGCTIFYSNWTKDVLRFDVCTNTQLAKFNTQPLPGDTVWHLRLLPDGGVLASDSQYIVRLDANGNQIQLYYVLTESNWWTGVDIAPDGTFWANNLATGNLYKFDLASGAILAGFNAGPPWTAVGVAIKP